VSCDPKLDELLRTHFSSVGSGWYARLQYHVRDVVIPKLEAAGQSSDEAVRQERDALRLQVADLTRRLAAATQPRKRGRPKKEMAHAGTAA
jgi:hypothetical protein